MAVRNDDFNGEFPVSECNFLGSGMRHLTGVDDEVYNSFENGNNITPKEAERRTDGIKDDEE